MPLTRQSTWRPAVAAFFILGLWTSGQTLELTVGPAEAAAQTLGSKKGPPVLGGKRDDGKKKDSGKVKDEDPEPDDDQRQGMPRRLTDEQINRIRFMELRAMRMDTSRPDPVRVKIPQETSEAFLEDMSGHPDFRGDKSRRVFMKLTAPQKLHYIALHLGEEYADKVQILSDPEVFKTFKKKIQPTVLRSCATSGCHATTTDDPIGFYLFKDPKRSDATTYGNFIALDGVRVGEDSEERRLIDRRYPDESLLLEYMLPLADVAARSRHPGNIKMRAPFRSRGATGYKNMLRWIKSLKHPAADYGLDDADRDDREDDPRDPDMRGKDKPRRGGTGRGKSGKDNSDDDG